MNQAERAEKARKLIKYIRLGKLSELYKLYCIDAKCTMNGKAYYFDDFMGWIYYRLEN